MSSKCLEASFQHLLTRHRFLDSWKAGNYTSAFDNMHRYFDYTMQLQGRTFYQYALVNMAIMQADFGCYSDAITAMHESIAMARENKDTGCLNFSLSWLYHFGATHPNEMEEIQKTGVLGTDKEALSFIKAKAKESGMWSLLSTTFLGEASVALSNVSHVVLTSPCSASTSCTIYHMKAKTNKGLGGVPCSRFRERY